MTVGVTSQKFDRIKKVFISSGKEMSLDYAMECFAAKDYSSLFILLDSQYRFWLFVELHEGLDDASFYSLLGKILTSSYLSFAPKVAAYLLNHPDRDPNKKSLIMTEAERVILENLPPEVIIFRGTTVGKPLGISWSLSYDVAKKFGLRHQSQGIVLKGKCDKKRINAYFDGRCEQEIIINPIDVTVLNEEILKEKGATNLYRSLKHNAAQQGMQKSAAWKALAKKADFLISE